MADIAQDSSQKAQTEFAEAQTETRSSTLARAVVDAWRNGEPSGLLQRALYREHGMSPEDAGELTAVSAQSHAHSHAQYLAHCVKAGSCTRMCAINTYKRAFGCAFIDAICAVDCAIADIVIGNLNEGL